MPAFAERAFTALGLFNGRLSALVEAIGTTPADPPRIPADGLNELLKMTARARAASDAIARSLTLVEATALDIVDMQVRLEGETARLASALRALGNAVEAQHFVREKFGTPLLVLDEAAQLLAAALFPSPVQGLREVNVKLWEFQKIQWKRYNEVLAGIVRADSLSAEQEARIEAIADEVARAFENVNTLLNDLAESRPSDAAALRARLADAPRKLTHSIGAARQRLEQASDTFEPFAPVIKASAGIAEDVAALLKKLTVPVFPTHTELGACCGFIAQELYDSLSGVQAFALMNILARLQATTVAGRPLLDGRHVQVTQVFPDRIYLEADRTLIDDLANDPAFQAAPAALHRFREGSFKQHSFRKGNLQVCYATRPGNRVAVDADIDLYRNPIPHLFGEVLVNHLTGNTTDQFKVRSILDEQSIPAIGSFELLRV